MDYHTATHLPHQQQPCDSYFVETDDSTSDRLHYEAIIKRQRQDRIGELLSQQARQEYMADIIQHMATMEVRRGEPCLMLRD